MKSKESKLTKQHLLEFQKIVHLYLNFLQQKKFAKIAKIKQVIRI